MTLTPCAMTSCSSRAMRERSSTAASRALAARRRSNVETSWRRLRTYRPASQLPPPRNQKKKTSTRTSSPN
jgi:hypothetical protein